MTDTPPIDIVLVEDDPALSEATVQSLQLDGFAVRAFADAKSALRELSGDFGGVVVSDVRMPGIDGIEFFRQLRELDPDLPVILVTGHGDVEMAVDAMKSGAADFLIKPFASSTLIRSIRLAASRRALVLENRRLRAALNRKSDDSFIGSSQAAQNLRALIDAVAPSEIDVLLEGEVGTGKTTLARQIHDRSPRRSRPFVTIDAGILLHEDAELLLFGREPTAGLSRTGLLERANGGTLFLDTLPAHPDHLHARLLTLLDSRSVLPQGAERARKLNLRIILARNLDAGQAREAAQDPFEQRLGAVKILVPNLASRREDMAELFRHFVAVHERDLGIEAPEIGEAVWSYLQNHDWPGNLRELNGYAHAFALGLVVRSDDGGEVPGQRPLLKMVADFERALLEDALRRSRGSVTLLEQSLQTPRKTLYDKLKRHDLKPQDYK